jgi:hypothetical protein
MLGTETTYVSSPIDLIGITNAKSHSVDYYQGEACGAVWLLLPKQFIVILKRL